MESFLKWCTVEWPKMVQNSWKFIFPDFSDKSREKQIFANFRSFLAFLRCITFLKDSNLEQNEGILALRMPSFCPKLESFIKVMHHRMAKNDTKFTKIHSSRDLSLKSGKINFHEFWIIFCNSTMHHFYAGLQLGQNEGILKAF